MGADGGDASAFVWARDTPVPPPVADAILARTRVATKRRIKFDLNEHSRGWTRARIYALLCELRQDRRFWSGTGPCVQFAYHRVPVGTGRTAFRLCVYDGTQLRGDVVDYFDACLVDDCDDAPLVRHDRVLRALVATSGVGLCVLIAAFVLTSFACTADSPVTTNTYALRLIALACGKFVPTLFMIFALCVGGLYVLCASICKIIDRRREPWQQPYLLAWAQETLATRV